MECTETIVVRSLKEAASFRKRHQSDENVKDKEDNHSPFKRKPKDELNESLDTTGNVLILNVDMLPMSNEEQKELMLH